MLSCALLPLPILRVRTKQVCVGHCAYLCTFLDKCVLHGGSVGHVRARVSQNPQDEPLGRVLLRPLANLDVPFGAGACTWELRRLIWCGEYRSAVKVSTRSDAPLKHMG
jgi:hypothetical protein